MWGDKSTYLFIQGDVFIEYMRFDKTFMTNLSIILKYVLVTYSRLYFVRTYIYFLSFFKL